jgi:hypothetical protein
VSKTTTNYHSTDGRFTGKTVTTSHSDGSRTVSNYKATGEGLGRDIFGPTWSRTSTTKVDNKGNSSTSTKKSSWW